MAVVASATGAAVFGLSGVAAGLAGGALLGAGAGALYSGITGDGNILNSALTGGLIGGALGGLGAFAAPAAGGGGAGLAAGETVATGTGALGPAATAVNTATPALTSAGTGAMTAEGAALANAAADPILAASNLSGMTAADIAASNAPAMIGKAAATGLGKEVLGYGLAGSAAMKLLGGQQGGLAPASATDPGNIRPYQFSANKATQADGSSLYPTVQYDAAGMPIMDTSERNYFEQKYAPLTPYSAKTGTVNPNVTTAAGGGLMGYAGGGSFDDEPGSDDFGMSSGGIPRYNVGGVSYDQATQTYSGLPQVASAPAANMTPLPADLVSALTTQYQAANPYKFSYDPVKQNYSKANPTMSQLNAFKSEQDRIAAEQALANAAYDPNVGGGANGGLMPYNLGGYSDGGRLLKGPGDGVSDSIPATIANKQPARLADGEFVIPARIVSELGNGSTDAGAKRLYAMMDRIQEGRKKTIGKKNVAKDTKAKKHLLA